MASTVVMTSNTSSSSAGFVRGKTLYKETTQKIARSEGTNDKNNINVYSMPTINNKMQNGTTTNSSLYTGSIFAAFHCDLQVK